MPVDTGLLALSSMTIPVGAPSANTTHQLDNPISLQKQYPYYGTFWWSSLFGCPTPTTKCVPNVLAGYNGSGNYKPHGSYNTPTSFELIKNPTPWRPQQPEPVSSRMAKHSSSSNDVLEAVGPHHLYYLNWIWEKHTSPQPSQSMDAQSQSLLVLEVALITHQPPITPQRLVIPNKSGTFPISTTCLQTSYSMTIPMNLPFTGSPVQLHDRYNWEVALPVASVALPPPPCPPYLNFWSLTQQFCAQLSPGQCPLFGHANQTYL